MHIAWAANKTCRHMLSSIADGPISYIVLAQNPYTNPDIIPWRGTPFSYLGGKTTPSVAVMANTVCKSRLLCPPSCQEYKDAVLALAEWNTLQNSGVAAFNVRCCATHQTLEAQREYTHMTQYLYYYLRLQEARGIKDMSILCLGLEASSLWDNLKSMWGTDSSRMKLQSLKCSHPARVAREVGVSGTIEGHAEVKLLGIVVDKLVTTHKLQHKCVVTGQPSNVGMSSEIDNLVLLNDSCIRSAVKDFVLAIRDIPDAMPEPYKSELKECYARVYNAYERLQNDFDSVKAAIIACREAKAEVATRETTRRNFSSSPATNVTTQVVTHKPHASGLVKGKSLLPEAK